MSARPTWIAFAGLPGTGKTTLARALAEALPAPRLDKDALREALFGPSFVRYERPQDDHCCRLTYQSARFATESGLARHAVLDGRTYARERHLRELVAAAREAGARLLVVECRCAPELARARIAADRARRLHPATNRTPELHDELAAGAADVAALLGDLQAQRVQHLALDTGSAGPDPLVARILACLR